MSGRVIVDLAGPLDEERGHHVASQIRAAAGREVDIHIDSEGGKLGAAILIALEIEEHDRVVTTTAVGEASSAAGLVMMAGDHRRAVRGATMLTHHARPFDGKVAAELVGAICEYTGQQRPTVWAWLTGDKTFDALEAKAAGLIDAIVGDDLLPTISLKARSKRQPTQWLRFWRDFYERSDLRLSAVQSTPAQEAEYAALTHDTSAVKEIPHG